MLEILKNFYNEVSGFDLIYIFFTVLSLIKCSRKGFVLSVLAASKWLLAWVIAIFLFPRIKPYVSNVVNINEYVLDIILGIGIFIIVIFIVLMVNKGISKKNHFIRTWKTRYSIWILFWLYKRIYNLCLLIYLY